MVLQIHGNAAHSMHSRRDSKLGPVDSLIYAMLMEGITGNQQCKVIARLAKAVAGGPTLSNEKNLPIKMHDIHLRENSSLHSLMFDCLRKIAFKTKSSFNKRT
jgi:hypothetical protein